MTSGEPTFIHCPEQRYVGRYGRVTMDTIDQIADQLPGVIGWLTANDIPIVGAPFLRYQRFHQDGSMDIEVGVPVGGPVAAQAPYHSGVLPAGRYATLLHVGHFDGLPARTAELLDAERRAEWSFDRTEIPGGEEWGARLEVYRTNPVEQPDPDTWETELRFRLVDDAT